MRAARALSFVLLLVLSGSACGRTVDLTKALQIEVVSSGWFDAGIVGGKNKLVPMISFRLKNLSQEPLTVLQTNAIFRRLSDKEEWGSAFLPAAGSGGLSPGATTPTLVAKSQLGYTGTESRIDMLKNQYFVDAKVTLFAKYASVQWVRIGEYTIDRQLLTP